MVAADKGFVDVLLALLKAGAELEHRDNVNTQTQVMRF